MEQAGWYYFMALLIILTDPCALVDVEENGSKALANTRTAIYLLKGRAEIASMATSWPNLHTWEADENRAGKWSRGPTFFAHLGRGSEWQLGVPGSSNFITVPGGTLVV